MLEKSISIPSVGYRRCYNFQTTLMGLILLGGLTTCIGETEKKLEDKTWWADPCHQVISPVLEKLRHGRSSSKRFESKNFLTTIKDQLNFLIINNRENLAKLEHLYWKQGVRPEFLNANFTWLKLKKKIRDMQSRNGRIKLRKLHKSLQFFAGILEKLSLIHLETHGNFDKRRRNSILHDTKKNFKAFICSVKEALVSKGKPIRNFRLEDMRNLRNWPTRADLTKLSYLEPTMLKKLEKFLDNVEKVLATSMQRRKRTKSVHKNNDKSPKKRLRNRRT